MGITARMGATTFGLHTVRPPNQTSVSAPGVGPLPAFSHDIYFSTVPQIYVDFIKGPARSNAGGCPLVCRSHDRASLQPEIRFRVTEAIIRSVVVILYNNNELM
jgi:hypothetical protein